MSIINLKQRITLNDQDYENNKRSERSLIYVNEDIRHDACSPEILILTVGDSYYANSQSRVIPKDGLVVKPGESKVIETKQKITTPLNVIGLIFGLGTNIYQNGFVSPGKIDQGYCGSLKIGFYNGGTRNITFKRGNALASVIFLSTEETLPAPLNEQPFEQYPSYKMTKRDHIKLFLSTHWIATLSLLTAVAALIIDIFK